MPTISSDALIALRPGRWERVVGTGVRWSSDDDRRQLWLEPGSEAVLERLERFDTRERHRQRLLPLFGDVARVDAVLAMLAARDLLVEAGALLVPPADDTAPDRRRAPLVAIRAHRRPASLARLLDGLRAHEARHGAARRHLVVDDTREGDPAVAEVVATARRGGLDVRLFGAAQRGPWLAAIARAIPAWDAPGPLRALLDPALPAATGARAWNTALLFAAGTRLALLDDDFHLPWRTRMALPGVELGGNPLARAHYHYTGIPEAEHDGDALAAALDLCGRSAFAATSPRAMDAAGLPAAQVADWRDRRVGAVITGTCGAYAWDSAVFLSLGARSGAPGGLLDAPFDEARLEADAVSVAVDRPTLLHAGGFTPLALDLGRFAPFASTAGKADDTAFLHLLGAVRPRHCALELPWLVGHAPPEPRQRRARAEAALLADPNVLLGSRIAHLAATIDGSDPTRRWPALCALAASLGGEDDAALARIARRWRAATLSQVVALARRALEHGAGAPDAWRRHVLAILDANQRALAEPEVAELLPGFRLGLSQLAQGEAWAALWDLATRESAAWFDALP
jgi:hypothetical protein